MTWLPTFETWQAGAIAAGLAIPALLILYFLKLRRKEVAVASTLLWRKAIQDLQVNAPFQKLRRNLLLLLQLILLILLLLALMRPVTNYTAPPGKISVILIDRSASMSTKDQDGRSRLDQAKIRAKELVDSMPKDGVSMVVAFDDRPEAMQSFTSDPILLKAAIDRIKQTERRSDINLAYQLADAQSRNYDPEQNRSIAMRPDVRVFSDGRLLNTEEAHVEGEVNYHKLGSDKTANIAVVELSAKRNYERPTEVQVFARLANFGPEPIDAPVRLSVEGKEIDIKSARADELFLLPERWDEPARRKWETDNPTKRHHGSVDFKLTLPTQVVVRVEQLNKAKDGLPLDDFAQVIVPPPKTLSTLVVTDGNPFLANAAQAQLVKAADMMGPAAYEEKKPANYDVILFDNYKPTFIPEQGNFIWFAVVPDGIKTKVAADTAGKPVILQDLKVLDWKRDHPILRELAMRRIYVSRSLKLNVPRDQEMLLEGKEVAGALTQAPLITIDREPGRTHLIVAFDPSLSNWPFYPSYPKFIHQAYQFLSGGDRLEARGAIHPGDPIRIPRATLQQIGGTGQPPKKITIDGPDGKKEVPVPEAGEFVLPPLDRIGIYTTDPAIPGYEKIAVNVLDANESNLQPADKVPAAVATTDEAQIGGPGKRRLELWWWLALVALAVLLVEWWVYTRRVHL